MMWCVLFNDHSSSVLGIDLSVDDVMSTDDVMHADDVMGTDDVAAPCSALTFLLMAPFSGT